MKNMVYPRAYRGYRDSGIAYGRIGTKQSGSRITDCHYSGNCKKQDKKPIGSSACHFSYKGGIKKDKKDRKRNKIKIRHSVHYTTSCHLRR